MQSMLLLNENTEMNVLEEKFSLASDFRILHMDSAPSHEPCEFYLDLTFDIFNQNVDERFLFGIFSGLYPFIEAADTKNGSLIIIKNYPYRTNIEKLLRLQRIIESFISYLSEFYNAKTIFIPSVISRLGFQNLKCPPVKLLNALRMDKTEQVGVRESSRFYLIYDMDIIGVIFRKQGLEKNLVVEGLEISLHDIYERACRIIGNAPVNFNPGYFINYEYPAENADTLLSINYDLEDMFIDITSFLF